MLIIFYCILFILWAIFGSFGGVIIERGQGGFAWSEWKNVFGGRSYCPWCKQTLTRRQLIPFGGRLIQKGKCFRCSLPIPRWYMREEFLMWVVFVLTGYLFVGTDLSLLAEPAQSVALIFWLLVNRWFVLLILADLFWYELNMYVWILLLMFSVIFQVMGRVGDREWMLLGWGVMGAVYYGVFLWAAWWQTKKEGHYAEGFGIGDVYMAWLLGSLVWLIVWVAGMGVVWLIQLVLLYMVVSSGLWLLFRVCRMLVHQSTEKLMPFLPAMIVAFRLFVLFGEWMMSWVG